MRNKLPPTYLLVCLLLFIEGVSSSPIQPKPSLYEKSDHVTLLDVDNFNRTINGQDHAWLVQFYSSYCGHCINFAPIFKGFVKEIIGMFILLF